jgi:predicted nucleotidyltransferase
MVVVMQEVESLDARRVRAVRGAKAALMDLAARGVSAVVTGSLADGTFGAGSDVDLLVTNCPKELKYTIEGLVEDHLGDIPFDVIYQDEIPTWRMERFTRRTLDARSLR